MRIAFLDSWLQSTIEGSGTAANIGGLQRALIAKGHGVSRLAPPRPWPRTLTVRRLLFNLHLPQLLRTQHYDLIVGFDIDGFLWSRQRGPDSAPYIANIMGVSAEFVPHERGLVRRIFQGLARLEGYNARHADGVITISNYCREVIVRHYNVAPKQIRVVPVGLDLARWRAVGDRPKESDGATILCVARQYPRKHVADLLHALPLVRQAVPAARAIIVGDGPEHVALRALVEELRLGGAALLTGALPDDELEELYRRADVFCLPSVQEGFGLVFLEALACGLPVVATQSAAVPEVVLHGQGGLLVPPSNPTALAQALIKLLQNPELRATYGTFGRTYVEQFDWPQVANRFLEQVEPFVSYRDGISSIQ